MGDPVQFRLVVGLGNPGDRYRGTRHNVGFEVIDEVARRHGISVRRRQFRALVGDGLVAGVRVVLVEPQTYMNLSGESVGGLARMYRVAGPDIIVVSDDVALPIGKLRLRLLGSAGGHNGLKSLEAHLGTQDYKRVRIGVGGPQTSGLTDHVLGRYTADERLVIDAAVPRAADALEMALRDGFEAAMNVFNADPKRDTGDAAVSG